MRLTEKSVHGRGYAAKSGELTHVITKLGMIEETADRLTGAVCDHYCMYLNEAAEDNLLNLEEICDNCPLDKLAQLIDGDGKEKPDETQTGRINM